MENAWRFGEREILAELEADAREEPEGEPCDQCGGSGLEKLDPRTFDPIPCPCCEGTGLES